ncbi:hypothetical protein SAMN05720472_0751 [Fibrobacter sp. UWR3]|nr:hypothetical protein SAMN05720472_0751 [Fibrobacter sp. UWR3]
MINVPGIVETVLMSSSKDDARHPVRITLNDVKNFYRKCNWPLVVCDAIAFIYPFMVLGIALVLKWILLS